MIWLGEADDAIRVHEIVVGCTDSFAAGSLRQLNFLLTMIGTTVGKYRIVALLGRGATGIVYKAVDSTLDREVAIKVLNPLYAAGDIPKRFRSEATTLAKLNHPEIATIHELLRTDANLLMVMELVRGETLEAVADRIGPMSPELAGRILDGILSALEHAHGAGIVHRDLKPANVMVTALGGLKIMDFGIARVRGAEHMTIDGCVVGTPAYMAPEQVLGDEIDGRADLYAVGVILYRLLAGRLPFDADAPMAMLQKQVSETPQPLDSHRANLPAWCDLVVQRALAKAPADRFQTAEEFRATVGRAIGLTPTLDLAKAVGVSTDVSDVTERQAADTIVISRTEAGLPPQSAESVFAKASAHARIVLTRVAPMLVRAKDIVATRNGALLACFCVVSVLAYIGGVSATNTGTGPRTPSVRNTREPEARSTSQTRSGTTTQPIPAARSEPRAAASTTAPIVFRATLILTDGGTRREEDARMSFARERLSVTADDAPNNPTFSAPYGAITAIDHVRRPAWRPPKKWGRVRKIGDDVLETVGIRDRHEISVHTDSDVVSVRVDDEYVNSVLRTLKERTGLSPDRPSQR